MKLRNLFKPIFRISIMDLLEKKDNENQNPFFKDLVTIMSNPQFRHFYNTYFTDWNEIESMVFFMKLYSTIEYEYQQRFNLTTPPPIKINNNPEYDPTPYQQLA